MLIFLYQKNQPTETYFNKIKASIKFPIIFGPMIYLFLFCRSYNIFQRRFTGIFYFVGDKAKGQNLKSHYQRVKCSCFGKFGMLCFHVTSVLVFVLLPYHRRIILTFQWLVSTKSSHILKQTCFLKLHTCLSICDLLVDLLVDTEVSKPF